jgi:hypothetical protein
MVRTTLSLLVAVAVAAAVGLARVPALLVTGPLTLAGHDRVVDLPDYGAAGTTAVGYRDQRDASVELPVRNVGTVPLTVHGVEPFPELLGMVETLHGGDLPATVPPGETARLTARVRFANCEYYTERAVNRFHAAQLEVERLGVRRTVEVAYPREVVLRSPTILGCPARSTDRSARQRLLARDE